ncbi:NTP transferase domain-containing protein [Ochrobactrum cytisi]|nr:NTP transferase domain-containing protein [Brucella cytisi]
MAASFHRAVDHARYIGADKLLICLGDMPNASPRHLRKLMEKNHSCCSALASVRLPPVMIMASDYSKAAIMAQGDSGARGLLSLMSSDAQIELTQIEAMDIDYPEDLDRIRRPRFKQ